ncbi:hypothetical protein F4802DRAFT_611214 [Xylaria palmicola]|nr:hypothetical protein F4802DRAFT_611214 [Xylaria palmicola]
MDDDLLAVGRWTDDRAIDQLALTRSFQKQGARHYHCSSTELHHREFRSDRAEDAQSNRHNHSGWAPRSEDELLERPPRDAIKEIRAAQIIQRQHPACFVRAEGERGNEATAKPSGRLPRMEQHSLKKASVYLPVDEHGVIFRKVYWSG